jgi:hypothetical protein
MFQLRSAILALLSLVGFCQCSRAAGPGIVESAPGLHLSVAPAQPTFRSQQEVSLRVILSNDGQACHPVLLDPEFSLERTGPRPFIRLSVVVRRVDGQPVSKSDRVDVMSTGISADGFYLLDCGRLIGVELRPSQSEWPVQFSPGRYHVEVSAELTDRSFVEKRSDLSAALSRRFKKSPEVISRLLAERTLTSSPVEFELERQP